jgi:hypothetical protein
VSQVLLNGLEQQAAGVDGFAVRELDTIRRKAATTERLVIRGAELHSGDWLLVFGRRRAEP